MQHSQPLQSAQSYHYHLGSHATSSAGASAREIVPMLCERIQPRSVVDFGCGLGDWLLAFQQAGVSDVLGLDGPWVPVANLLIPHERFQTVDFNHPIRLSRRFDLALCLEVAEHLGEDCADHLIDALTGCADVVCFSAAIPGQGGHEHVNEKFQDDWIVKFRARGFSPVDLIRPRVWLNERVNFWYRQNLLLFLDAAARQRTGLQETAFITSCVHPELYNRARDPRNYRLKTVLKLLPYYLLRGVKAKLG